MVVRRDLPIGVIAAQLVHAAGESSPGNLPSSTYAVVLAVPDEAALIALARRLGEAGVAYKAIREPDAPYDNALMALGLVPKKRSELRKYLSEIPLFRGTSSTGVAEQRRSSQELNGGLHPPSGAHGGVV